MNPIDTFEGSFPAFLHRDDNEIVTDAGFFKKQSYKVEQIRLNESIRKGKEIKAGQELAVFHLLGGAEIKLFAPKEYACTVKWINDVIPADRLTVESIKLLSIEPLRIAPSFNARRHNLPFELSPKGIVEFPVPAGGTLPHAPAPELGGDSFVQIPPPRKKTEASPSLGGDSWTKPPPPPPPDEVM